LQFVKILFKVIKVKNTLKTKYRIPMCINLVTQIMHAAQRVFLKLHLLF